MHASSNDLTQLTADHDVFRMQLDVLESAVALGPRGGAVLRDLCRELFGRLRAHVRRESRLAVSVSRRLGRIDAAQLAKFAIEHEIAVETLRVIQHGLPAYGDHASPQLRPALRLLVNTLRRQICDQEKLLFPMLRDELTLMEAEQALKPSPGLQPVAYELGRPFRLLGSP